MTRPPCVRLCPAYPGNPRSRSEGESPPQEKGHTVFGVLRTPRNDTILQSHAASLASAAHHAIGRRTTTIVPAPGLERMRMTPPCSSTSDLAMASPRPEPWWLLVSWL